MLRAPDMNLTGHSYLKLMVLIIYLRVPFCIDFILLWRTGLEGLLFQTVSGSQQLYLHVWNCANASASDEWIFCSGRNMKANTYIQEEVKSLCGSCVHWLEQDLVIGNLLWWFVCSKLHLRCSFHLNTQMWKLWKKFSRKNQLIHWMDS